MENLFDKKWTLFDTFKVLILGYTAYATAVLTAGISASGGWFGEYIRPLFAILINDGSVLFFEYLGYQAKNKKQRDLAQSGYVMSVILIVCITAGHVIFSLADAAVLSNTVTILGWVMSYSQAAEFVIGIMMAVWVGVCLIFHIFYRAEDPAVEKINARSDAYGEAEKKTVEAIKTGVRAIVSDLAVVGGMKFLEPMLEDMPENEKQRLRDNAERNIRAQFVNTQQLPALPTAAMRTPQTELARTLRGGHAPDVEPIDPDFDENAPIPAPRVFNPPANKIANDANGKGNGHGNFTSRQMPQKRFHTPRYPSSKIEK